MSLSLILACFWVLASVATAMLPMRRQYLPGITLLIAAPILLGYIAVQHGPWIMLLALAGALSMFRNPLIYFARRAMGLPVSLPVSLPADLQQPAREDRA
jgi:hypothetical protein